MPIKWQIISGGSSLIIYFNLKHCPWTIFCFNVNKVNQTIAQMGIKIFIIKFISNKQFSPLIYFLSKKKMLHFLWPVNNTKLLPFFGGIGVLMIETSGVVVLPPSSLVSLCTVTEFDVLRGFLLWKTDWGVVVMLTAVTFEVTSSANVGTHRAAVWH